MQNRGIDRTGSRRWIEQVGEYTIEVIPGEPSKEDQERWDRRIDNLVAWLTAEWEEEQRQQKLEVK